MKVTPQFPNVIEYSINDISEVATYILNEAKAQGIYVLGFKGDLGAGKTTLIKEIVKQLGVSDLVRSPTYSIQSDYSGVFEGRPISISHWDLYRISEDEASDMYNEYLSEKQELDQLLLIEWAERLGVSAPDFLEIAITDLEDSASSFDHKSPEDIHERRIIRLKCPEIDK